MQREVSRARVDHRLRVSEAPEREVRGPSSLARRDLGGCVDVSVLPSTCSSVNVRCWSDGQATKIAGGPRAVRRAVEHRPRQVLEAPQKSAPLFASYCAEGQEGRSESAAEAAKKVVVVDSVNAEKRRLLQKLLARQTAAGKAEAAAQTQQQIDSLA